MGNVRTALFNWLLAGHYEGNFILRIEDTDAERSKPEYEKQLMDDLRWLGLDWNEGIDRGGAYGPYRQSDRYEIYQKYAQQLLDEDKAFRCFCSEEELEQVRQEQLASNETQRYSGKCRHLSAARSMRAQSRRCLRPCDCASGPERWDFPISFSAESKSIRRRSAIPFFCAATAVPTYNFCCVIDDFLMKISHVIRGDGHLSNTHRQILIYEALGAPVPQFAHLSTILGPDGQKLSKRHGATSIEEFRRQGYLPEALANYLALLGWSSPEEGQEIMSLDEITGQFDLSRVQKNPAIFDNAKLDWMNRSYINKIGRRMRSSKLSKSFFVEAGLDPGELDAGQRAWLAQADRSGEDARRSSGSAPCVRRASFTGLNAIRRKSKRSARETLSDAGRKSRRPRICAPCAWRKKA